MTSANWVKHVSELHMVHVFDEVWTKVNECQGYLQAKLKGSSFSKVRPWGLGIGPSGKAGATFQLEGRTKDTLRKYVTMICLDLEYLMADMPDVCDRALLQAEEAARELLKGEA